MTTPEADTSSTGALTSLIRASSSGGEPLSLDDRLLGEIREIVRRAKRRHADARSPGTTDLLHRALERTLLAAAPGVSASPAARWRNREHFFGAIAKATLEALIDDHRRRRALKRGGGAPERSLDVEREALAARLRGASEPGRLAEDDIAAVAEALRRLEAIDERAATVVTLRFFYGLSVPEIAVALDQSERSVKRDWRAARAWLYRELGALRGREGGVEGDVSRGGPL